MPGFVAKNIAEHAGDIVGAASAFRLAANAEDY
jgi:hypothetical protein